MNIVILCIEIFLARIIDVSLGIIKTFFVVRENRIKASIVAFFEVFIWFLIAREALNTDIKSIIIPIVYSLGFATGTYVGILISSKFIHGNLTVNIVSNKMKKKDLERFKDYGFGLTTIKTVNKNYMLMIEIKKKDLDKLKDLINIIDKEAFIIVNESRYIQNGYFS